MNKIWLIVYVIGFVVNYIVMTKKTKNGVLNSSDRFMWRLGIILCSFWSWAAVFVVLLDNLTQRFIRKGKTTKCPFDSAKEYNGFIHNCCNWCECGRTFGHDKDMDEVVTVYRCNIEKEIDDRLCGEADEISMYTYYVCYEYEKNGKLCPNFKNKSK